MSPLDFLTVAGEKDEEWIARIQEIRKYEGLTLAVIPWMYPTHALFHDQPTESFFPLRERGYLQQSVPHHRSNSSWEENVRSHSIFYTLLPQLPLLYKHYYTLSVTTSCI